MNMGQTFKRAVDREPDARALVDPASGVSYTYREWDDRVTAVASALQAHGVGVGDRVGAVMRNRAELASLFCATQLVGAVFVPFNYRASRRELTHLANNVTPTELFFDEAAADAVAAGREDFDGDPDLVAVDDSRDFAADAEDYFAAGDGQLDPAYVAGEETSLVLHTGGTTGDPKGVPRSHENTYAAGMAHAIQASLSRGETALGLMSLSHTMGVHSFAAVLLLGGTWVAQRSFDPEETVSLVESEGVTSLYLVPTMYRDLVESSAVTDADLSSVSSVAFAGASMSPAAVHAVEDHFDPDVFVNHYGSTEVYTHTVCDAAGEKIGCAGRAGVNSRVRVVEPSDFGALDPSAVVDPDELGEVVVDVSSPEAFDGYISPAETDRAVVDGWFFTGDLGYRGEDGDLFVVGRVDDMIINGGENIYPVEVESSLESHGRVVESAVVGRPSERWNQTVAAFVTVDADPDEVDFEALAAALAAHCRESDDLADFKRPRKYFFVDELKKSNVGKVLRKELQKRELDIPIHAEVDV